MGPLAPCAPQCRDGAALVDPRAEQAWSWLKAVFFPWVSEVGGRRGAAEVGLQWMLFLLVLPAATFLVTLTWSPWEVAEHLQRGHRRKF